MKARGGMAVSTVLLIVAAALLWSASRMTWVEYTSADGLRPPIEDTLNGGEWAPASTPLALLLIAGIAAMFAVRGWWVRVVGALLALAGAAAAVQGVSALFGDPDNDQVRSIAELSAGSVVTGAGIMAAPVLLTIVAGLLAIVAAAPLISGKSGRQGLSSAYAAPAARKEAAAQIVPGGDLEQRQIWDALDAGADPTDNDEVSRAHPEPRGDQSDS